MSGLIKNGPDAAFLGIRPIAAPAPVRDDRSARLRREAEQLKGEIAEKDALVETLRAACEQARRDGFDEGFNAGLASADDGRQQREALLGTAIEAALADKRTLLANSERLAALLAHDCLDLLFGASENRAALVSDLIDRQLTRIDTASVVSVSVSAQDFDEKARAGLAARFAAAAPVIHLAADLPSGSCKFGLALGEIDLGLNQQWGVLRALLEELTRGEGAA